MDELVYYFIMHDLNQIGKMENFVYYIYEKDRGWIPDINHLLSDRLMGYDGLFVGCISMLSKVDEITKEKAYQMIQTM